MGGNLSCTLHLVLVGLPCNSSLNIYVGISRAYDKLGLASLSVFDSSCHPIYVVLILYISTVVTCIGNMFLLLISLFVFDVEINTKSENNLNLSKNYDLSLTFIFNVDKNTILYWLFFPHE